MEFLINEIIAFPLGPIMINVSETQFAKKIIITTIFKGIEAL